MDGKTSNLAWWGGECTASARGKSTAEWRVDLGTIVSIHHMLIQYSTDNTDWSKIRFLKSEKHKIILHMFLCFTKIVFVFRSVCNFQFCWSKTSLFRPLLGVFCFQTINWEFIKDRLPYTCTIFPFLSRQILYIA